MGGISKYYTETIIIKRKVFNKINGVNKETFVIIATILGAIDKAISSYIYTSDKETFVYTDIVFAPNGTDIKENDIIEHDNNDYDVISVIDPMRRKHHIEVLLSRKG